ncbi:bifunctional DNA primase/polymerase [Promicromonospora vindobonensis]|uniref:Bifunctional DNA primase/polymerase n=1 Tax=Promicromonospora vindobonensis TaxID=195748 RepID=A0ABW5W1C6_9MICO
MDASQPAELDRRIRAVVASFGASSAPEVATQLVRAGVPVFPCVPGGKRPLTRHGFQDATTDLAEVERMWQRWPDANLAIPAGRASGFDVVDVDLHEGASGRPSFDASLARGLTAGWAFTVRTPSGGLHAYFPNTREQACWTCARAHVDFRSDGGYVVVPPSRVVYDEGTAGVYLVAAIASRVSTPVDGADLRAFLEPPRPRQAPAFTADAEGVSDPERLAAWVAAHPEDGRKRRLFWAACRAVEAGHDLGPTLAALGNAALHVGVPARVAESAIRSAFRHAHPRVAPSASGRPPHPTVPGGARRPEPPTAVIS